MSKYFFLLIIIGNYLHGIQDYRIRLDFPAHSTHTQEQILAELDRAANIRTNNGSIQSLAPIHFIPIEHQIQCADYVITVGTITQNATPLTPKNYVIAVWDNNGQNHGLRFFSGIITKVSASNGATDPFITITTHNNNPTVITLNQFINPQNASDCDGRCQEFAVVENLHTPLVHEVTLLTPNDLIPPSSHLFASIPWFKGAFFTLIVAAVGYGTYRWLNNGKSNTNISDEQNAVTPQTV